MSLFSSKTERFWPLVPPIGAVCTEKTEPFSGHRQGNTKSLLGLPQFLIRVMTFALVRVRVTELGSFRSQSVYWVFGPFWAWGT